MKVKPVDLDVLLDIVTGRADTTEPDDPVDVFVKYMCGDRFDGRRGPQEVAACRSSIIRQYPWMGRIAEYPDEAALADLLADHGKTLLVYPLAGAYTGLNEAHIGINSLLAGPLREAASNIAFFLVHGIPMRSTDWNRPRNDRVERTFTLDGENYLVCVSLHYFQKKGGESALMLSIGQERCVIQFTKEAVSLEAWLDAEGAFPRLVNPGRALRIFQGLAAQFHN